MTAHQETLPFGEREAGQAFASSTGYLPNASQPSQSRDSETLRSDGGAAHRRCKAISLTQPWATLVVIGEKEYETRCWSTRFRGTVWIQAAKGFPRDCKDLCEYEPFRSALARHGYTRWQDLPIGALVGRVEWVNCERTEDVLPRISEQEAAFGDYSERRFASRLGSPIAIAEPIACRGALSFWEVPEFAQDELMRRGLLGLSSRMSGPSRSETAQEDNAGFSCGEPDTISTTQKGNDGNT